MENKKYVAKLNNAKISSQKARVVTRFLNGKSIGEAKSFLEFSDYKVAGMLKGLLNSAIANASVAGVSENDLILHEIRADEGRTQRGRGLFGSRGRFKPRKRRTSNLTLILMQNASEIDLKKKEIE